MKPIKVIGTGFTIVTFTFVAFSGVAMFFDLKSGFMKDAHEYLGIAMVVFALVHIFLNFKPFKLYFKGALGALLTALIIATCGYGIYSVASNSGKSSGNPAKVLYMQVANQNVAKIKEFFSADTTKFSAFLQEKGIGAFDENLSLRDAAKKYDVSENEILGAILPSKGGFASTGNGEQNRDRNGANAK